MQAVSKVTSKERKHATAVKVENKVTAGFETLLGLEGLPRD